MHNCGIERSWVTAPIFSPPLITKFWKGEAKAIQRVRPPTFTLTRLPPPLFLYLSLFFRPFYLFQLSFFISLSLSFSRKAFRPLIFDIKLTRAWPPRVHFLFLSRVLSARPMFIFLTFFSLERERKNVKYYYWVELRNSSSRFSFSPSRKIVARRRYIHSRVIRESAGDKEDASRREIFYSNLLKRGSTFFSTSRAIQASYFFLHLAVSRWKKKKKKVRGILKYALSERGRGILRKRRREKSCCSRKAREMGGDKETLFFFSSLYDISN